MTKTPKTTPPSDKSEKTREEELLELIPRHLPESGAYGDQDFPGIFKYRQPLMEAQIGKTVPLNTEMIVELRLLDDGREAIAYAVHRDVLERLLLDGDFVGGLYQRPSDEDFALTRLGAWGTLAFGAELLSDALVGRSNWCLLNNFVFVIYDDHSVIAYPVQMPKPVEWEPEPGNLGILHAVYKGARLRIQPIGCTEWDGYVNDVKVWGTDVLYELQQRLLDKVDGIPPPQPCKITVSLCPTPEEKARATKLKISGLMQDNGCSRSPEKLSRHIMAFSQPIPSDSWTILTSYVRDRDLVRVDGKTLSNDAYITGMRHDHDGTIVLNWSKATSGEVVLVGDVRSESLLNFVNYSVKVDAAANKTDLLCTSVLALREEHRVQREKIDLSALSRTHIKPVHGLLPASILRYERMTNIEDAMARYRDANMTIPSEWVAELAALTAAPEHAYYQNMIGATDEPT